MLVWESKKERLIRAQRNLERDLEQALLEEQFASAQSEVIHTRAALTTITRANEKLVETNAILTEFVEQLRSDLSGSLAARDAMDAAMHERGIEKLVGRSVVIHTPGLHSIEGVLTDVYPDLVVLKHAYYVDAESGARETLAGEIKVPRPFEFVQELTRDAGAQDS